MSEGVPTRQEKRYQNAVERERNREVRETIDIFETPLLLRQDISLLSYIEYERLGKIRASGKTFSAIQDLHASEEPGRKLRENSIHLELPMPYDQQHRSGDPNLNNNGHYNETQIAGIANLFKQANANLELEPLIELITRTTDLAHASAYKSGADMTIAYAKKDKRQEFLRQLLANPQYQKIWLMSQKMAISQGKDQWRGNARTFGLASMFQNFRGATFLVDPGDVENYTIHDGQQHHDFMFEILAMKDIPESHIRGYLEYDQEDADMMLPLAIQKDAADIYGYGPNGGDRLGISRQRKRILDLVRQVTARFAPNGRENTPADQEKTKQEVCELLHMDIGSFTTEEAYERLDETPGLLMKGEYIEYIREGISKEFPDIDPDTMTMREINKKVFEHQLPRLKELFPHQSFSVDTVESDCASGLAAYIVDRFKIEPQDIEEMTKKDFVELLVKSMGVPIYAKDGSQIWPEQNSYDNIHAGGGSAK